MPIVLVINGRRQEISGDVVHLCPVAGSDLAIATDGPAPPQAATIRRMAERWLIESQAGTIRVGDSVPGRVHWLQPGSVIRLTELSRPIVFESAAAAMVRPLPPADDEEPIELHVVAMAPQQAPASR